LSVHWVSDEEIMDVILTDESKLKASAAVKRMMFWRMRKERNWLLQPGMGSLWP
jgi:hypothetical protein